MNSLTVKLPPFNFGRQFLRHRRSVPVDHINKAKRPAPVIYGNFGRKVKWWLCLHDGDWWCDKKQQLKTGQQRESVCQKAGRKAKIRSLYTTAIKHCQGDKTFLFFLQYPLVLALRWVNRERWKWNKMKKSVEPMPKRKDTQKKTSPVWKSAKVIKPRKFCCLLFDVLLLLSKEREKTVHQWQKV